MLYFLIFIESLKMKIRKIHIKNYKMFHDVTLDFTDINGHTLDTIVIAGINASGKTSLLQLLQKLFSESLNLFKVQSLLYKYDEDENALICDKVSVELELSETEKSRLIALSHKFINKINKMSGKRHELLPAFKVLEKHLKRKIKYFTLIYQLEKVEKGFIIRRNDFHFFGIMPEEQLKSIFKLLYFPAVHSELKEHLTSKQRQLFNLPEKSDVEINSDGIVVSIDIFSHKEAIETHIVKLVQSKLIADRNLIAKDVIKEAIDNVNQLLDGISLNTKLVDINSEQAIFQSFSDTKLYSSALSGGEKQLYYKAILFDKLRPQNSLIMVDEPETSLHPTWQQEVLKLYENIRGNNQVILVTHSPHIIASVHPENLFILKINKEQKTVECVHASDNKEIHTRGNEPNDILEEVMGTPLRDLATTRHIEKVIALFRTQADKLDLPENEQLIDSLISNLGRSDPLVMRIFHKLAIIQAEK